MTGIDTTSPVLESLELYAEHAGDPVPGVYERFFAIHPEAVDEFAGDHLLEKRMMAGVLQMLADLADEALDAEECDYWVFDHIAYEVDETMAFDMFDAVVDTLREGLGARWTPEMESAWPALLDRLRTVLGPAFTRAGA